MKTIALITLVGVAALALYSYTSSDLSTTEAQFQNFLGRYGKNYGTTEEYNYRLNVFKSNLQKIPQMQANNPRATFGITKFADQTQEEMDVRLGLIVPIGRNLSPVFNPASDLPDIDWTNMWDDVKDQGACGSCWAFSATGAFEARYQLHHGNENVDELYAEQELVDCDTNSYGCNGGWMDNAFMYLQDHGFCTEVQYPYTASDGKCNVAVCEEGPHDEGYYDITQGEEQELIDALAEGPVSVAVDASTWFMYSGGILDSCNTNLNHGVILAKTSSKDDSLTIRNSWGADWGEDGYIRLAAHKNTCGVTNVASYPTF